MTTTMPTPGPTKNGRVLATIERVGNRLPHPVYLFLILLVILGTASTVLDLTHSSVTVPGTDDTLDVQGLFTMDGLAWWLQNAATNFATFPPVATVLMLVMAVGVAERSGLLTTAIQVSIGRAPAWVLPYVVAFVAMQGHLMSDAAFLVIPPLAAVVFKAAGRNPVAGLLGSFACVSAGYASGFTIGSLDALYSGISEQALAVLPSVEGAPTHILVNYYFTASSSIVLGLVGGFIIDRVLEPRLPAPVEVDDELPASTSRRQVRALVLAVAVGAVYTAVLLTAWLLPGSALRGEGGSLIPSPLLSSVPVALFVGLILTGAVHGFSSGTFTSARDLPEAMGEALTSMTGYIVLMFVIAQVTAIFTWSNVGTLLAVKSASGLESIGLTGLPLLLLFVLLVCFLNLFIMSGSALWSLMAPVFVPTFVLLGLQPAVALAAFRIGDSATALVTPMNVYLFAVLAMLQRYEPQAQFGTLISRMAMFVVPFLAIWSCVLVVFYLGDIPLGPGAGIHVR
ncbi:MAG: AbgT family transporter [Aeromicrobium sp.]